MELWKRIGIGTSIFIVGLVIGVAFFKEMFLSSHYPRGALIEFRTAKQLYLLPSELVDPGSVFNYPVSEFNDGFGPSVDLIIGHDLLVRSESGAAASSNPTTSKVIAVTLTQPSESHRQTLLSNDMKAEAITLTGEFKDGVVEYDENLRLYRVFQANQGKSKNDHWDLVRIDPRVGYEESEVGPGAWVATCARSEDGKGEICNFEEEVDGFYAFIAASEADYLVLDEITNNLAERLKRWEKPESEFL